MGRSSRDQRGQFSTMVRVDGRGRIVPGSNILKKGQKPHEGRWQKKDAYECCNPEGDFLTQENNSLILQENNSKINL